MSCQIVFDLSRTVDDVDKISFREDVLLKKRMHQGLNEEQCGLTVPPVANTRGRCVVRREIVHRNVPFNPGTDPN